MQKAAVLGIGQIKVQEHWDKSLRELAGEAALFALEDAGLNRVDGIFVSNMLSGTANKQAQLGTLIADWIGLKYSKT